jgi:hypothetical protein
MILVTYFVPVCVSFFRAKEKNKEAVLRYADIFILDNTKSLTTNNTKLNNIFI